MIPTDKARLGSPVDAEEGCGSPTEQLPLHLNSLPSLSSRSPMNQDEFDKRFEYLGPPPSSPLSLFSQQLHTRFVRPCSSPSALIQTLLGFIPIFSWLPKYKWREDLMSDCIGGFTSGVLNVPQAIAYSQLAFLSPEVGLFTSLIPSISYMIFGTSRHCSIGPFAIVALTVGQTMLEYGYIPEDSIQLQNFTSGARPSLPYTNIQIASALCFQIGVIQLLIFVSGLSFVTSYLSDELISGFTTAASIHVMVTQLKDLTGLPATNRKQGFGHVFFKLWDIFGNVTSWNMCSVLLSLCTMVFLLLGKHCIDKRLRSLSRSFKVIIPYELIAVIVGIVLSDRLNLNTKYKVKTVDKVPTGFRPLSLPPVGLLFNPNLFVSSLTITIVALAVHMSLAKMFSRQFRYSIDVKQEFCALGIGSLLSSLFPVFPNSCSLSRTMLNVNAGSRTQMSTVFSSSFLLMLILYGGSWLDPLPMSIVASTIFIALLSAFSKMTQLVQLWKISKIDFAIWLVAFMATLLTDVLTGLAVSVAFALFTIIIRSQWSDWHILGNISGSMDFRDSKRFREICFVNDICIIRFDAPLLFVNLERFRRICEKVTVRWEDKLKGSDECLVKSRPFSSNLRFVIIDCSAFSYVDKMGVNCLKDVHLEMSRNGITMWFAGARANLRELFELCGFYGEVPKTSFFPTIYDAVYFAQEAKKSSLQSPSSFTLDVGYTNLVSSIDSSLENIV